MELLNEKELAHVIGGKRKCPKTPFDTTPGAWFAHLILGC